MIARTCHNISCPRPRRQFYARRRSAEYCSASCRVTAHRRRLRKANANRQGGEWYTPLPYIEAAREVLGRIDLDPATCAHAQARIQARTFYTQAEDGLQQRWRGNVWCNPPYRRNLIGAFVDKLLSEVKAGRVTATILLVHCSANIGWFQSAAKACDAVCFPGRKLRFESANGPVRTTSPYASAMFYFGRNRSRFRRVFGRFGVVFLNGEKDLLP
jgi:ParB family chromosome partitioning protein